MVTSDGGLSGAFWAELNLPVSEAHLDKARAWVELFFGDEPEVAKKAALGFAFMQMACFEDLSSGDMSDEVRAAISELALLTTAIGYTPVDAD